MRGNVFFHSVSRLNRVAVNNKQYNTPDITLTVTSLHTHYCQTDCHSLANNSLTTVDLQQLKERYFQQSSSSWREAFSRSLPSLRLFARTVSPPLAAGPRSLLHPCRGRSGGSRWSTVGHRLISNKYITNFTNSLFFHSFSIHSFHPKAQTHDNCDYCQSSIATFSNLAARPVKFFLWSLPCLVI